MNTIILVDGKLAKKNLIESIWFREPIDKRLFITVDGLICIYYPQTHETFLPKLIKNLNLAGSTHRSVKDLFYLFDRQGNVYETVIKQEIRSKLEIIHELSMIETLSDIFQIEACDDLVFFRSKKGRIFLKILKKIPYDITEKIYNKKSEIIQFTVSRFYNGYLILLLNSEGKVYQTVLDCEGENVKHFCIRKKELKNIIKISSSGAPKNFHHLFMDTDGKVYGWGFNDKYQLGPDTEGCIQFSLTGKRPVAPVSKVRLVHGLYNIINIIAGIEVSFFVDAWGKVYTCGSNKNKQTGFNKSSFSPTILDINFEINNIISESYSTFFFDSDNNAYYCGGCDEVDSIFFKKTLFIPKIMIQDCVINSTKSARNI